MKIRTMLLALSASLLATFITASAGTDKANTKSASRELKNQTVCPVMGNPIDSAVYTDIQGQRVYHCCPGCGSKLKADPDKYFKKAAADGILYENIQKQCPVSGEDLEEKTVFTDYEGRRIYFCCDKCRATFKKDAKKYLKILDEQTEANKEKKQTTEHNHNHG